MSWMRKDKSIPTVLDEALVAFFPAPRFLLAPRPKDLEVLQQLQSTAETCALTKSISQYQRPGSPGQILPLRLAAVMAWEGHEVK